MTEFKKGDNGKPRFGLIPPNAELEVAAVLTHGGDKYGDDNWKQCDNWQRYVDALGRHWNAYRRGERNDPETGKHHLAHLICCALFQLEHDLTLPRDGIRVDIPPERYVVTDTIPASEYYKGLLAHPHCRGCD